MTTYRKLIGTLGNEIESMLIRDDGVFISALEGSENPDDIAYREWLAAGNTPGDPIKSPPTTADIIIERERRLALGFDYDFKDTRGIHHIGTTDADMKGWDEVSKVASAMLALGDQTTVINIVTNTGPAAVTALEWQHILIAAATFRQPIWAASFVLQAMNPIPTDITVDALWV